MLHRRYQLCCTDFTGMTLLSRCTILIVQHKYKHLTLVTVSFLHRKGREMTTYKARCTAGTVYLPHNFTYRYCTRVPVIPDSTGIAPVYCACRLCSTPIPEGCTWHHLSVAQCTWSYCTDITLCTEVEVLSQRSVT